MPAPTMFKGRTTPAEPPGLSALSLSSCTTRAFLLRRETGDLAIRASREGA